MYRTLTGRQSQSSNPLEGIPCHAVEGQSNLVVTRERTATVVVRIKLQHVSNALNVPLAELETALKVAVGHRIRSKWLGHSPSWMGRRCVPLPLPQTCGENEVHIVV